MHAVLTNQIADILHFNDKKQKPETCNFIKKEALALVLSCEFCEISRNAFLTEYLWWLLLWPGLPQVSKMESFATIVNKF